MKGIEWKSREGKERDAQFPLHDSNKLHFIYISLFFLCLGLGFPFGKDLRHIFIAPGIQFYEFLRFRANRVFEGGVVFSWCAVEVFGFALCRFGFRLEFEGVFAVVDCGHGLRIESEKVMEYLGGYIAWAE